MARVVAEVDLGAIRRNCQRLGQAAPESLLCAVVKADGYGHGMIEVAAAAVDGGASWLGVAAASEGLSLRDSGFECPILVMGAIEKQDVQPLVARSCDFVIWTEEALMWAMEVTGTSRVHVKLDTGMGRLGTRDSRLALSLAERAAGNAGVDLIGVTTHFATADEADTQFLTEQNDRFGAFARQVKAFAPSVIAHAANSAATLRMAESHHDMVRCGIGVYGLDPMNTDPAERQLEPAMTFTSRIGALKLTEPGETVGYGRNFSPAKPSWIGIVTAGYADGVRRSLGGRVDCLVNGRRAPIVGSVSMDNIAIDLGADPQASIGDRVVLFGKDGDEAVLVEDWARECRTINYEIVTSIGGRTEFIYRESE